MPNIGRFPAIDDSNMQIFLDRSRWDVTPPGAFSRSDFLSNRSRYSGFRNIFVHASASSRCLRRFTGFGVIMSCHRRELARNDKIRATAVAAEPEVPPQSEQSFLFKLFRGRWRSAFIGHQKGAAINASAAGHANLPVYIHAPAAFICGCF